MGTLEVLESMTIELNYEGYIQTKVFAHRERIIKRIDNFIGYYHQARYGGMNEDQPPYYGLYDQIEETSASYQCENETSIQHTFNSHFACFSVDFQINMIEPFFINTVMPLYKNATQMISCRNLYMTNLRVVVVRCSDLFFYPMFKRIVANMRDIFNETIPTMTTPAAVLLAVCFIISALLFYQTIKTEEKLKFALSLLLHCPPDIVLQTSKIMDILSGDFHVKTNEGITHRTEFFDSVLKNIPDSVIVLNEQLNVQSINRATERIYGLRSDFVGQNVRTFFTSSNGHFSKNVENIFNSDMNSVDVEFKNENDNYYLHLTLLFFKNHTIIMTRDQTQNVSYNTLISEEKSKSDSLLASILPPKLISRVQNGEENISFSVQSASILFLDIVEFTPWCAANTASMIMSTLNLMFKYFDSNIATHSTLTKIKCIGDCYMAAGGIFAEVNQPAVHAKEIIEFGLEAIDSVRVINEQLKQTLRIRVGVNTGGPIVAGVLGIDKPTFEILGPAINMAQQMEHHGVPMQVHISRSSYELIYGCNFKVIERGQIEIKNGSVRTYLVEGK
ncbi:Adenylate and Guanylate cyclase catalytic domain containing protein [Tritrichomonas foetus]|uniref:Adenylate and Guanylate cyclase catalytic domain containing protein n=1 Tax=Tritrichomonas foetus TaxID=1144522 RepID=A0A1J4J9F9_9EUKA|nr:Adenylate and Guanylate cyclase catalytic domain containing protein [Tritrichomonas foetus]|eukprot:OHS95784.1 Adenylate and Guanylate cyclase catalytic domain containing protein [Tritrichomonas foetus]